MLKHWTYKLLLLKNLSKADTSVHKSEYYPKFVRKELKTFCSHYKYTLKVRFRHNCQLVFGFKHNDPTPTTAKKNPGMVASARGFPDQLN